MLKSFVWVGLMGFVAASAFAGDFYECRNMLWGNSVPDQHKAKIGIYMDPPRALYVHNGTISKLDFQSTWKSDDGALRETFMDFVSSPPDYPHFHLRFSLEKKTVALASTDWQGFLNGNCELAQPWDN